MSKTSILEKISNTAILAVPFVPFVVLSSLFFPFITGKAFVFRTIVIILFASWFLLATLDKRFRPRSSKIFYAVLAFVIATGIATLFSTNVVKSFWSNFERMEGYLTILFVVGYFISTAHVLKEEWQWKRLFAVTIGASAMMAIYGIFQLMGINEIHQGGVRLDGTFGNATYLAVYMLFHIFLTLFWIARYGKTQTSKYIGFFVALLQLIILYFTATRGSILGLIGGLVLTAITILVASKKEEYIVARKIAWGSLLTIIILIVGFLFVKDAPSIQENPVLSRFANISLQDNTTASRFIIWDMAFQGFKERPIFGYGQGNFIYVFSEKYNPGLYAQEAWFDRAHNIFFDWLISAGIFGLLTYLSLFFFGLYSLYKTDKLSIMEKSILFGLFAAYGFHNIFVFDHLYSYILFFTLLAYLHSTNSEPISFFENKKEISGNTLYVNYSVVFVLAVFIFYKAVFVGYDTGKTFIQALSTPSAKYNVQMRLFQDALSKTEYADPEIRQHMVRSIYTIASDETIPNESKQAVIQFGATELIQQTKDDPRDPRYWDNAGTFFLTFGDSDNAIIYLEKAKEISPKKDIILINLSRAYLAAERNEDALSNAKYLYELDKRSPRAWEFYFAVAEALKKDELSKQILEEPLLNGNESLVINKLNREILESPGNIQSYVSLSFAYMKIGKFDESLDIMNKAKGIFPDFEKDIEGWIKQITEARDSSI